MKIVAFAGRKVSGKSSRVNFVMGQAMLAHGVINDFKINEDGQLWVVNEEFGKKREGVFPLNQNNEAYVEYMRQNVYPYCRDYNLADPLKKLAMTFGLTWEQCYGTDEQKNSLTELRWEDMPGVVSDTNCDLFTNVCNARDNPKQYPYDYSKLYARTGKLTARQFLQYLGSDIFRRMDKNYWTRTLQHNILADKSELALVGDVRFKNEKNAISDMGGKVIFLMRNIDSADTHSSEQDLRPDMNFDLVIDNRELTHDETNEILLEKLTQWNILKPIKRFN